MLRLAHLGLRPRRRRLLGLVRIVTTGNAQAASGDRTSASPAPSPAATLGAVASGQALPESRMLASLDETCRAGAAALAGLVEADDHTRSALLREALSDDSSHVRLRALGTIPRAELAHYCFDQDPYVARSAMLRWSTAGMGLRGRAEPGERARIARVLARSPHPAVRRLAEQELPRETPWMAHSPASRASAWRLAVRERDTLLGHVRRRVKQARPAEGNAQNSPGGVDEQVSAILVARRLGLARVIAMDLAELLEPATHAATSGRVAATAAAALGDVDDAVSRGVLRRALAHPDPRVRANAVEAIGVQRMAVEDATTGRDRDYGSLIELKADPHHRVRANAIRALLQLPPACPKERRAAKRADGVLEGKPRIYEPVAVDALSAMLCDERAGHRLAGVWLAGRVLASGQQRLGPSWSGLNARLAEIGAHDTDPRVRERARGVCDRMSAVIRAAWTGHAASNSSNTELIGTAGTAGGTADGGAYQVEPVEPVGTI